MTMFRLLLYVCLLSVVGAISFSIKFENDDPAPSQVSVIENYRLLLRCVKDDPDASDVRIVWRKRDDASFALYNSDLTFTSVQIVHDGDYYCENDINKAFIDVTVRVLYPPNRPKISGPKIVEKYTSYSLFCLAASNPGPTYYWTTEDSSTAQVVARGPTYTASLEENVDVYCWVENTMFPSQEASVTVAQYQKAAITAIYAAHIWELYPSYTFNVSTDVSVDCRISGSPYPTVYWTRDGDSSFRFNGERLFIPNVKMNFTGYYSCHVENNLQPSGLPERVGSDVKNTFIRINDLGINDICEATCRDRVNEVLESCPSPSTAEPCGEGCGMGLIAALVIGWIIAAILIVAFMFCCIKNCDEKRKASANQDVGDSRGLETELGRPKSTTEDRLASRPVLPVRPDISRRQDEGTYAYITGEDHRPQPLPVSKMSGKYDYVEPNPVEGHDYLILSPPSPASPSRRKADEGDVTNQNIKNGFSNPTGSSFIQPQDDNQASPTKSQISPTENTTENYLEPVKID